MEAKDLRIGNLFYINPVPVAKTVFTITEILKNGCHAFAVEKDNETFVKLSSMYSIPITEGIFGEIINTEWELNNRFGTRKTYNHIKFKAISIEFSVNRICIFFNDDLIHFSEQLHEFQNIFFCLTECELAVRQISEGKPNSK